jgi:DNA-binding beta-propeller fold protein YncE
MTARRPLAALGCLALAAQLGCFTDAEGRQPVPTSLYFPTGVVVSPGRSTLYVANSDFDLQYAAGWVQALDLALIRSDTRLIVDGIASGLDAAGACAQAGLGPNPDRWLNPGACAARDVAPYVRSFVFVGAFASGLLLVHDPAAARARLFAPVRGDPSITYFDVEDDRQAAPGFAASFALDCQVQESGFCSDAHRLGQDPEDTLRGIQLPADPVGIAATTDGTALVTAHQTQTAASLLFNDWAGTPLLSYTLVDLPAGPTELAAIPEPAFVPLAEAAGATSGTPFTYRRGFALTFRSTAELDILRYVPDSGAVPPRPFIQRTAAVPITISATNFDSRGIAVVDRERRDCESTCGGALECLVGCAEGVPLKVFVANRAPASLLIGRLELTTNRQSPGDALTSAVEELLFYDSIPLTFGPSRVEVGQAIDPNGEPVDRVFVVAFDSRTVFVVDPDRQRVEAVVRTGRGPHDIAVDHGTTEGGELYSYLYVGHFTDSYLGVVDLDMRHPLTYGQMVASIGIPSPPAEAK